MEKSSSSWVGSDCCLPEDIIEEILIRLPVKSLVRFKSVCKAWKAIITNPTFTKTQSRLSQHVSWSHIIVRRDNTMFTLYLDVDDKPTNKNQEIKGKIVRVSPNKMKPNLEERGFKILGSCDGMLCVHVRDTNNIYLWNPSTNESRLIPWPVSKAYKSCSTNLFGFGFVSSVNDYKIVLAAYYNFKHRDYYDPRAPMRIHVYSLRQNRWREIARSSSFDQPFKCIDSCGETVLLNDALHWIVASSDDDYETPFILKFDMVNETFEMVAALNKLYHDVYEDWRCSPKLCPMIGAFGDDHKQLCIYQMFSYYRLPNVVKMWVLDIHDQHNYSWKKKFELEGRWDNLGNDHRLLTITGNDKVLIFERFLEHSRRMEHLLIYDWRCRERIYIQAKNEYCLPYDSPAPVYYVVNYVPTLISPNSILE